MASVLGGLRTGCRLDGVDVMGMSPSCHCICPGTPGVGSSGSGGGGGGGGIPTTVPTPGCTPCTLVPTRLSLTLTSSMFSFTGSANRINCGELPGTYTLSLASAPTSGPSGTVCLYWRSSQYPVNTNTFDAGGAPMSPTCPEVVAVNFPRIGVWLLSNATQASWYVRIKFYSGYAFSAPAINWWNWSSLNVVTAGNCVNSYVVNYVSQIMGADPTYTRQAAADSLTIVPSA